MAFNVS